MTFSPRPKQWICRKLGHSTQSRNALETHAAAGDYPRAPADRGAGKLPAPRTALEPASALGGTAPADLSGRQPRDEREQTERQQSDAEPEAGSGTTGRSAGGCTRQRRGAAGLVVAEQVAERCLRGRSRGRRVAAGREDERDGLAAGAGAVENVCAGAAWAVEPENTCWPVEDVTLLPDVTVLPAELPPLPEVLLSERAGGSSALPRPEPRCGRPWGSRTLSCSWPSKPSERLRRGCSACARRAPLPGAATENEAGAKPPVGREAVMV